MGGPGASVLLRNALTKQHKDELEIWLRSITSHLEKGKWAYEFWLKKDAFPGTVSDCLFYLSVEDVREYWDDDEKRQVKELLGYLPEQSIGVSSGCNQDNDHTTLGQFMLHLAEVYDGLIDMGGAIMPPLDEVSGYVPAMPGKVYEIEYTTASGRRAVSHIVDVSFLRAWIEHPNFYMIK